MADKLTKKGWRDIGMTMLECPALLSPFGGAMLEALRLRPRRWPLAVSYGLWWTNHQLSQRPGRAAWFGFCASQALLRVVVYTTRRLGRRLRRY